MQSCRNVTSNRVSYATATIACAPCSLTADLPLLEQYPNNIHSIVSTGAVLTPGLATWLSEAFGPVCQIGMSGGTELCGSLMHGTRSLPSFPGEIAVKALGMDVVAFSPDGAPVSDGEAGELVCRKPFPNMPVMFLNDPGKKRYHAAYFEQFPRKVFHSPFSLHRLMLRRRMDSRRLYESQSHDQGNICTGTKVSSKSYLTILFVL